MLRKMLRFFSTGFLTWLVVACTVGTGDVQEISDTAVDITYSVPVQQSTTTADRETTPLLINEVRRARISYLEEIIPPCIPVLGSQRKPCEVVYPPPIVEPATVVGSLPGWPLYDDMPYSLTRILLGETPNGVFPSWVPHIVVRATVLPGTTRCDFYKLDFFDHTQEELVHLELFQGLDMYHCFADFRINEYVVGTGPPKITVSLYSEDFPLREDQRANWENIKDDIILHHLEDPQSRVAEAYEGKELVMFLQPADNIAVEAWERGYMFSTWFIHRVGDEVRAVEANIRYALTDEQRSKLDLPLDELIKGLKQAGEERFTMTGGRIGVDADLPMLVTDANLLKDFYPAAGTIYYESGGKTVLPPPVPGEGDPAAPTIPTNEGTIGTTLPAPGEETSVPPSSDDAGLTIGQDPTTTPAPTTTIADTPTTTGVTPTVTTVAETVTGTTTTTTTTATTPTTVITTEPGGEDVGPSVESGLYGGEQETSTSISSTSTQATVVVAPLGEGGDPEEVATTEPSENGAVPPASDGGPGGDDQTDAFSPAGDG